MGKKNSERSKINPYILGVIPARGGSKGVKRKNLKLLNGRPLIYWSIKAAKESSLLDRFIVSTEDPEIKSIAQGFGAEVLDRPKRLARDFSTTLSVLQHVVREIREADVIVLLQPTSPIRDGALIDRCIDKFLEKDVDSLATGFMSLQYEWGSMQNTPRQKLKGWFYDDGNVYVQKASSLRRGNWVGKKKYPMVIDRRYNFEIDDEIDFFILEVLMKKRFKLIKKERK